MVYRYDNSPFEEANLLVRVYGQNSASIRAWNSYNNAFNPDRPYWHDVATLIDLETQSDETEAEQMERMAAEVFADEGEQLDYAYGAYPLP